MKILSGEIVILSDLNNAHQRKCAETLYKTHTRCAFLQYKNHQLHRADQIPDPANYDQFNCQKSMLCGSHPLPDREGGSSRLDRPGVSLPVNGNVISIERE